VEEGASPKNHREFLRQKGGRLFDGWDDGKIPCSKGLEFGFLVVFFKDAKPRNPGYNRHHQDTDSFATNGGFPSLIG